MRTAENRSREAVKLTLVAAEKTSIIIIRAYLWCFMSRFSIDKTSGESNLLKSLQERFFATARRNKILAKWAGGRLGYKGAQLNGYVRKIILSYILLPNDRKLVDRIEQDFKAKEIEVPREDIVQKMNMVAERVKHKREMQCAD